MLWTSIQHPGRYHSETERQVSEMQEAGTSQMSNHRYRKMLCGPASICLVRLAGYRLSPEAFSEEFERQ
jgi:hypothetical protein